MDHVPAQLQHDVGGGEVTRPRGVKTPQLFVLAAEDCCRVRVAIAPCRSRATGDAAWRYLAMQLSKPSVIILPGRLRPMKTIRLSRFSSTFHGR